MPLSPSSVPSEDPWTGALLSLQDPVLLLDQSGLLMTANRAARQWLGGALEVGMPFHEALHPGCDQSDCPLLEAWWTLTGAVPAPRIREYFDNHFLRHCQVSMERLPAGNTARALLMLRDTTDLVRITEPGNESEARTPNPRRAPFAAALSARTVAAQQPRVLATASRGPAPGSAESLPGGLGRRYDAHSHFRAMGYLVRGLAHEIGNPLAAMKTSLQVLLRNLTNFDRRKIEAYLERVLSATNRIQEMVERVLRQQDWLLDSLGPLPAGPLVNSMVNHLRDQATESGVQLSLLDTEAMQGQLLGDLTAVEEVLHNVLRNAIEACEVGGSVQVEVLAEESWTVIEVRDDGTGIRQEDRALIFKPFFTTKSQGSGIGLAHALHLMRQMAGKIEVESRLGQGSCFRLSFLRGEAGGSTSTGDGVADAEGTMADVGDRTQGRDLGGTGGMG